MIRLTIDYNQYNINEKQIFPDELLSIACPRHCKTKITVYIVSIYLQVLAIIIQVIIVTNSIALYTLCMYLYGP